MKRDIHNAGKSIYTQREKVTDPDIREFLLHKRLGRFGQKIDAHQESKYISKLKILHDYIGKDFKSLTEKDSIAFYEDLDRDSRYKASTKNTFIRVLKTYIRWLSEYKYPKLENLEYDKIAKWWKPFKEEHDIPAFTKKEIETIADLNNIKNKAIILTLFDTGARAQEFLNIRFNDIEEVPEDDDFLYRIHLRKEFSKTKGRKIECRLCKDSLKSYLNTVKDPEPNGIVFRISYAGLSLLLKRSVEKAGIKKRISPHLIRHSSATFYASILKSYPLRYRFGWSMGDSTMCKRYIDEEQIYDEGSTTQIKNLSIAEQKEENVKQRIRIDQLEKDNEGLKRFVKKMDDKHKHLGELARALENQFKNFERKYKIIPLTQNKKIQYHHK